MFHYCALSYTFGAIEKKELEVVLCTYPLRHLTPIQFKSQFSFLIYDEAH